MQLSFLFDLDQRKKDTNSSGATADEGNGVMIPYFPSYHKPECGRRRRLPSVNFLHSAFITIIFLRRLPSFGSLILASRFEEPGEEVE